MPNRTSTTRAAVGRVQALPNPFRARSFTNVLGMMAGAMLVIYLGLMVSTVLHAALQTQLAKNVRDAQTDITRLETSYYAAMATIDDADPYALGFVPAKKVTYVNATQNTGLSLAN